MANGVRITPTINTKGIFEVQEPFLLPSKRIYEVIAIREFPDLWAQHVDVYQEYYLPYNLSEDIYKRDKTLGAAIVTLQGEDGVVYIPDTFIVSYPDLGLANYNHVVMSVSLGPIHISKDLSGLQNELAAVCSKFLGVNAVVKVHTGPVKSTMTSEEAAELERIRKGMIDIPVTSELQHLEQLRKNQAIVQQINQALLTKFKT